MRPSLGIGCSVVLGALTAGCGYTSEEWGAQIDKSTRLEASLRATEAKLVEAQGQADSARKRLDEQMRLLDAAGLDAAKLRDLVRQGVTAEERDRAIAESRQRAQKLEQERARFDVLRTKVAELGLLGVTVGVEHDHVAVTLPADALFEKGGKGAAKLTKDGKDTLGKVGAILKAEPALATRDWDVVAHVDTKSAGKAKDALEATSLRAREAMTFLVEKAGLQGVHLRAVGRGDTDPVASNDADEGRKKNRRLELVLLPSSDELLDLKPLTR